MADFGVTPEGFRLKTVQDILEDIETAQRQAPTLGPDLDQQLDSVVGQLNNIFGDKLAEAHEVLQAIYSALNPANAEGVSLENLAFLTGVIKIPAASSSAAVFLNLDAGASLAGGEIVSIGPSGEQWVLLNAVTNPGVDQATIEGEVISSNTGPIVGNAFTIDTIVTPVAGWNANAALDTEGSELFTLADGQTLLVEVDEGAAQTVLFENADFGDITNATAAEVAAVITTDLAGAAAIDASGKVRIESDTNGTGSSIRVVGGTAAPALGFSQRPIRGFNHRFPAQLLSGNAETYALVNGYNLFLRVDGGSTQTISFLTGEFVDINNATAVEVANVITSKASGAIAYAVDGKVQIESTALGVNSRLEVTGGQANALFGFVESEEVRGVSGDADLGRNIETDSELRTRRQSILALPGGGTLDAISSALLAISDIQRATVFENPTDFTDAQGRPPHSIEAVVRGGDDTEIAQAILDNKAAGIRSYRDPGAFGVTVAVNDNQGNPHDINFTRVEEIQMYVEVDVSVRQTDYGNNNQAVGDQQVKEAIKDFGDTLVSGSDVIMVFFRCAPLNVTGVVDVTNIKIEDIPGPTNTANIPIDDRQRATFAIADIVVNTTFI